MNSPALPMFGKLSGTVVGVAQASIHGDVYYDIALETKAPPARPQAIRLPSHLCGHAPAVGDRLEISFLMGQANGVTFLV
jgi:hypothetical protein